MIKWKEAQLSQQEKYRMIKGKGDKNDSENDERGKLLQECCGRIGFVVSWFI
jgi:hypothetical protein